MTKKPSILIIGGKSLFGQKFHKLFKKHKASVRSIGRAEKSKQKELVQKADIVIVSVPIEKTSQVIKEVRNFVRDDALLTDFTSLKDFSTDEMKKTKSGCGILGMHPLFGPLVNNLKGQHIVFCSIKNNPHVSFLRNIFKKEGLSVVNMTPKEHDEHMAYKQALTHLINISFLETVTNHYSIDELLKTQTPIFKIQSMLGGRIINGNPKLYANIQTLNPQIKKVLAELIKNLKSYQKIINKKDTLAIEKKISKLRKKLGSFPKKATVESKKIL